MHFTTDVKSLLGLIQAVKKARDKRPTVAALGYVLLDVFAGRLTATCTNLHMALTSWMPVTMEAAGMVALPVKGLEDLLRAFTGLQEISVHLEADSPCRVTLTRGDAAASLNGLPADEFPSIPPVYGVSITIPSGIWPLLLRKVSHCMKDIDDGKPLLCGVHLARVDDGYEVAATDTHRLAYASLPLDGPDIAITMPRETIHIMAGMRGDDLTLTVGDGRCEVACGALILRTHLIEGQFPAYRRVVPEGAPARWIVNRQDWLRGLKRAYLVSERGKVIHQVAAGCLTITSYSEEGAYREALSLCTFGEDHETSFNAAYLIDALARMTTETVTLYQGHWLGPCRLDDGDAQWTQIIMPMQLL